MRKRSFKQETVLSILILLLGIYKDIPKVRYYGVVCEVEDNDGVGVIGVNSAENIEEYDDSQSTPETTTPDSHDQIYTKKSKTLVATPFKNEATIELPKNTQGDRNKHVYEVENTTKKENKSKYHWRRESDFKILQIPEIANSDVEGNNHNNDVKETMITKKRKLTQKMHAACNKQYSKSKALNSGQYRYGRNYKTISEPVYNDYRNYKRDDLKQLSYSKNKPKTLHKTYFIHEHRPQYGTQQKQIKIKDTEKAEMENEFFNESPYSESKPHTQLLRKVIAGIGDAKTVPKSSTKHRNKYRISHFKKSSDLKETNEAGAGVPCKHLTSFDEKNIKTDSETSISFSDSEISDDSIDYTNQYKIFNPGKQFISKENSKINTNGIPYKQVNDVRFVAHDSLLHRNKPNIYFTTEKQANIFDSFINTGPNFSSIFVDTQHAVQSLNSSKRTYKRNGEPYKNYYNLKNHISELDYPTVNKFSYNPDISNDQDFTIWSDLENNEMLHSEENKNHPEIEHRLSKSFNEHGKHFTNTGTNSGKLAKQKHKKTSHNEGENDEEKNKIHEHSNEMKDFRKQSYNENYIGEELSLQETSAKKELTQGFLSPESHIDKSVTEIIDGKFYQLKKITEQTCTENDVSQKETFGHIQTSTKATTFNHATSLKKSQEGKSKYREHVEVNSSNKQCPPHAGPQKFKWCSDEIANVKDQEYEDALRGKVATRIVEVILAKVHKSSKMSHDFGFCSSEKKNSKMVNENKCDASNSILKSQDLQEIMASMEKLSSKTCNRLPPKLKEFLEWLIKVKSVQSAQRKGKQFKKHSNCLLGDTAFLFHQYGTPSSYNQEIKFGNERSNYEDSSNSLFEDFDKCDLNENIKDQNDYDVDMIKHDAEIKGDSDNMGQNNLISDNENNNQLDNMKSKRYVFDENINNPYSSQSLIPEGLNAEKGKLFESKKQLEQLQKFKQSPKNDISREDEIDLNLYSGDRASNNAPYNHLQYKKDNDYRFNEIKNNFDDLTQVRKKPNKSKLPLQEFLTDKQEEFNFEELINHDNINEELRTTIINERENENKEPDTYESDQQLGFDTPIEIRIPDEEDTIM